MVKGGSEDAGSVCTTNLNSKLLKCLGTKTWMKVKEDTVHEAGAERAIVPKPEHPFRGVLQPHASTGIQSGRVMFLVFERFL